MSKLYNRNVQLNETYKDGSRAKDLGAAITTNPYPWPSTSHYAWTDGWNKIAIESTPVRLPFVFNTLTTASDPGYGGLGFNNAALASVTTIRFNFNANNGSDIKQYLNDLPAGTNIVITNAADITNTASYVSVSQTITTWGTVAVTYGSSAGSLFLSGASLIAKIG
jgi:hypothetical protein